MDWPRRRVVTGVRVSAIVRSSAVSQLRMAVTAYVTIVSFALSLFR
jgi:hypothetical protein